jgi:hypothetical protein
MCTNNPREITLQLVRAALSRTDREPSFDDGCLLPKPRGRIVVPDRGSVQPDRMAERSDSSPVNRGLVLMYRCEAEFLRERESSFDIVNRPAPRC